MKKSKDFPLYLQGYFVRIVRNTGNDSNGSNYNVFTHIFKDGDTNPLFGGSHNDNSTDKELIADVNIKLERYIEIKRKSEILKLSVWINPSLVDSNGDKYSKLHLTDTNIIDYKKDMEEAAKVLALLNPNIFMEIRCSYFNSIADGWEQYAVYYVNEKRFVQL